MPPAAFTNLGTDLRRVPALVWLLCATTFVNRAGSMVLVFLALYAKQELGLSGEQVAHILVAFGVASVAAAIVGGRATDRFGARAVMFTALAGAGTSLLLAAFATGYWTLLAAITAWAFLGDTYRPAAISILSSSVEPAQRKFAQSLHQVALNLGTMVGSGAGGVVILWHPSAIFWIDGATSLLAAFVLVWGAKRLLRAAGPAGAPKHVAEAKRGTRAWRDKHLLSVLAALMPVWAVVFQILGPLSLTLVDLRQMPKNDYGLLLGLESLLTVIIAIPLARSTGRWCHYRTLALGALLVGMGMGGYGWIHKFWQALAVMPVWSIGLILMLPAATALVAEISPRGRDGEYAGVFTASFSVAFACAPGLGVIVLERFGPEWLFGSGTAICAVCALVLLALRRAPQIGAGERAEASRAAADAAASAPADPVTASP